MAKYRIHIDPPPPDPDAMDRHQDFEGLFQDYQTHARFEFWRNLYRKPRSFGLLLMVAAVSFLILYDDAPAPEAPSYRLHAAQVDSLPEVQALTLDAKESHQLTLSQELRIAIPADSWENQEGQAISGLVRLNYRLIDGPRAAFAAGVPRPWRQERPMEDLRLVEVRATQHDQPVQLKENKPLRIYWRVAGEPERWQIRQLDTTEDRWTTVTATDWQVDSSLVLARPQAPVSVFDLQADTLVAKSSQAPQAPQALRPYQPSNQEVFPELRGKSILFWELINGQAAPGPEWGQPQLRPLGEGVYELNFARRTAQGIAQSRRVPARFRRDIADEHAARDWLRRQQAAHEANLQAIDRAKLEEEIIQRQYELDLEKWSAQVRDGSIGELSYEVPYLGVSGLWREEKELKSTYAIDKKSSRQPEDSWQPWCYAIQGGAILPVKVDSQAIRIQLVEEGPFWWYLRKEDGKVKKEVIDP
ncbi:MAG: hypothetical protein AAF804_09190 [Bacteroidota bacterium]